MRGAFKEAVIACNSLQMRAALKQQYASVQAAVVSLRAAVRREEEERGGCTAFCTFLQNFAAFAASSHQPILVYHYQKSGIECLDLLWSSLA